MTDFPVDILQTMIRLAQANLEQAERILFIKSGASDFGTAVRRAVYALWSGKINKQEFDRQLGDSIDLGLRRAWNEGLRDVGVEPRNMDMEAQFRISNIVVEQWQHIEGLADWIIENSKENHGLLRDLQLRVSEWSNRYDQTRVEAHLYGPQEQHFKWSLGPTEKHCEDKGSSIGCVTLNGVVAPASHWRARDLHPGCRHTTCGGWHCGCSLDPTDEPLTEGGIPG